MTVTHRKKPVEVEAHRLGDEPGDAELLASWAGGTVRNALADPTDADSLTTYVDIRTREGTMTAAPGDWIIREPAPTADRRFYPCKPEIFDATYEQITDTEEQHA